MQEEHFPDLWHVPLSWLWCKRAFCEHMSARSRRSNVTDGPEMWLYDTGGQTTDDVGERRTSAVKIEMRARPQPGAERAADDAATCCPCHGGACEPLMMFKVPGDGRVLHFCNRS